MKTKKQELKYIEAHQEAFDAALTKATISVRSNAAFVGLNKIREPLAYQAALKAIGYEGISGFAIPPSAGEPTREVQELVDSAFLAAVEAAAPVAA